MVEGPLRETGLDGFASEEKREKEEPERKNSIQKLSKKGMMNDTLGKIAAGDGSGRNLRRKTPSQAAAPIRHGFGCDVSFRFERFQFASPLSFLFVAPLFSILRYFAPFSPLRRAGL